jgi:uncharacterized RDD family membrane protein YckC
MSSTPEQDPAGQWDRDTQQGAIDRPPSQPGAPGTERFNGAPSGGVPPVGGSGQPQSAGLTADHSPRTRPGRHPAPVSEAQTRVSGRRVFQYWIDAFLVSIVPYLVSIPFDASSSTVLHIIGGIVAFVLFLIIGFWYWVIRPRSSNGQTFAMKWFGVRVVSKNGGPATTVQYFIRWIGLIFDAFPWVWPFTGLLGLFVMVVSRYRQRVGDHMARTLVISEGLTSEQAAQYAVNGPAGPIADQLPNQPQRRPETGL